MILGFKDRFVPMAEDGSKTHSIRGGCRWKVGMRADLYARPRQKGMRLLFRAMVVKVEEIEITPAPEGFRCPLCGTGNLHHHLEYSRVTIEGVELAPDERDAFAWRDGFRPWGQANTLNTDAFLMMMEFWSETYDIETRPFRGQVIHWDYAGRFMANPKKPKKARCEEVRR